MLIRANILPARQNLSYICAWVGVQCNRRILSWWANYAVHIFMSNYGSSQAQNWLIVLPRLPMRFLFLPKRKLRLKSESVLGFIGMTLVIAWPEGRRNSSKCWHANCCRSLWLTWLTIFTWKNSWASSIRNTNLFFLGTFTSPPLLWVIKPLRSLWSTKIVENFLALGYLHTNTHTRTHSIWP